MSYSNDLREKVVLYVEKGGSRVSAANLFSIGERTVRRWVNRKKDTGSSDRLPRSGGIPSKIDLTSLKDYVVANPDKTILEISIHFSHSKSSIQRALKRIGFVKKKDSSLWRKE